MLLIVSTLCLKQFETWFFPQIIELLNGYSDDITAYGLSKNELFFPNQNIPIKFNKYLWDIHKFVEGDKKNEKYIQNNTDFIWARNLVSLRMQSEECILNPLETVAKVRTKWRSIINTIRPEIALISNPAVLHTGIVAEVLKEFKIPFIAFERGCVYNSFEIDDCNTGPNGNLTLDSTLTIRRELLPRSDSVDRLSIKDISASHSRDQLSFNVLNEKYSSLNNSTVLGIIGIDETTTGSTLGCFNFIHHQASSLEVAISIAKKTGKQVFFKPHPASIHLTASCVLPDNLTIFIGNINKFVDICSHFIGFGSTADFIPLLDGKPYCLFGRNILSKLEVIYEPDTIEKLYEWVESPQKKCNFNTETLKYYLDNASKYLYITQCNTPKYCLEIIKNKKLHINKTTSLKKNDFKISYRRPKKIKQIWNWLVNQNRGFFNANIPAQPLNSNPNIEFCPPGHFYSPIPGPEDILRREVAIQQPTGFDLSADSQVQLLQSLYRFYPEMPFSDQAVANGRFSFSQNFFCHSDAIYLYSLLRQFKPKRFIEIGSGHSSALALDTAEFFLNGSLEFTFIEPYPDRLKANLKPQDSVKCRLIEKQVQNVPLEIFDELEANDFLFVDSSHVSKVGSDVNYILFKILPRLKPGVLVHIHDIFFPFEYPADWFKEGRAWNEVYLVRAFLQYNTQFQIRLFSDYLGKTQKAWIAEKMPLCLKNTGASLWLQKCF